MSEHASATPRHRPWIKVVAAVVAVVLVATAGFVAFTLLSGEPDRTISLPDSAAGMTRNTAVEEGEADEREAAGQQFASLHDGPADASLGIYEQSNQDRGPTGSVNVVGVEIEGEASPATLVDRAERTAEQNGLEVERVDAGEDAEGFCASGDVGTSLCLWATTTSFGQVSTATEGWTVDQLRSLMVDVRADVETTG